MAELVKLQTPQSRRIIIADNATSIAAGTSYDFFDNAHSGTGEYNELPDGMFKDGVSGFITGLGFWDCTALHAAAQTPTEATKRTGTLIDVISQAVVVASVSGVEFFRAPLIYCPTPNIWAVGNMADSTTDAVSLVGPNGWRPTFGRHPFTERARIKVSLQFPIAVTVRDQNVARILACGLSCQTTQPLA